MLLKHVVADVIFGGCFVFVFKKSFLIIDQKIKYSIVEVQILVLPKEPV